MDLQWIVELEVEGQTDGSTSGQLEARLGTTAHRSATRTCPPPPPPALCLTHRRGEGRSPNSTTSRAACAQRRRGVGVGPRARGALSDEGRCRHRPIRLRPPAQRGCAPLLPRDAAVLPPKEAAPLFCPVMPRAPSLQLAQSVH